jgi:hypothetical protein
MPGHTAVIIARSIHVELEGMARPHDALDVQKMLSRLGFLASRLPEPVLLDDGLPAITA